MRLAPARLRGLVGVNGGPGVDGTRAHRPVHRRSRPGL